MFLGRRISYWKYPCSRNCPLSEQRFLRETVVDCVGVTLGQTSREPRPRRIIPVEQSTKVKRFETISGGKELRSPSQQKASADEQRASLSATCHKTMVEFHKVEVPRLRLPQKQHPLPQYGSKFDVGSGPVGTSRIDPGLYSPAKRKEGKIPGYSGHLPLVSEGHVIGRSFGFLSRLDSTVPLTFRQAVSSAQARGVRCEWTETNS